MRHDAYALIVFDWDGTLMDSEARIVACVESAVTDLGVASPGSRAIRNIIGLGLHEAMAVLFPESDRDFHLAVADRYRHHFLVANPTESSLFPGVEAMLEQFVDRGTLLAVATGKSRRGLDAVLGRTGLARRFHATRCADETRSKPHPQMLEEILEETGIDARAALMVGDTVYDIEMAHAAGVDALAVSWGVHEQDRLVAARPLACLPAVTDLPDWLAQRTGARSDPLPQTA